MNDFVETLFTISSLGTFCAIPNDLVFGHSTNIVCFENLALYVIPTDLRRALSHITVLPQEVLNVDQQAVFGDESLKILGRECVHLRYVHDCTCRCVLRAIFLDGLCEVALLLFWIAGV